jgi:hypothetical protein
MNNRNALKAHFEGFENASHSFLHTLGLEVCSSINPFPKNMWLCFVPKFCCGHPRFLLQQNL